MPGTTSTRLAKAWKWVSRPRVRRLMLPVAGWLLGKYICPELPDSLQGLCSLGTKLAALMSGG